MFIMKWSVLLAVLLSSLNVEAQVSRRPSMEEIVDQLSVHSAVGTSRGRARGQRGMTVEDGGQTPVENPGSINLEVNFEYNSAELSPDARLVLDNLGRALQTPALQSAQFLVGGHTDARGGDAYNMELSRKRAQSVINYLVKTHGIANARLMAKGFGKTQLFDAANPESLMNRRVQVTNLSQ